MGRKDKNKMIFFMNKNKNTELTSLAKALQENKSQEVF